MTQTFTLVCRSPRCENKFEVVYDPGTREHRETCSPACAGLLAAVRRAYRRYVPQTSLDELEAAAAS